MSVREYVTDGTTSDLTIEGCFHRLHFFSNGDHVDRDTQCAMVDLYNASAFLDWEDVEAIHRWTSDLIEQRKAQGLDADGG